MTLDRRLNRIAEDSDGEGVHVGALAKLITSVGRLPMSIRDRLEEDGVLPEEDPLRQTARPLASRDALGAAASNVIKFPTLPS